MTFKYGLIHYDSGHSQDTGIMGSATIKVTTSRNDFL